MTFSGKTMAITVACTLIGGLLLGFMPEHLSLDAAKQETQSVQRQLSVVQKEEDISNFTVRSAMLYTSSQKRNYSSASNEASGFFTDLRQYTDALAEGDLKQQLRSALDSRDEIIGGLAKADPSVTEGIQRLFLKMQSIQTSVLSSK
jgi:hypothetical protein